jgi:hypothetical protein
MFWFKKTILLTTKNFTAGLFLKMIWKIFKTSNSIEGWHRSLNAVVSKKNPSLVELFQKLQMMQNNTELSIFTKLIFKLWLR